jgi:uncharacterized protein (TIGR02646 family)
MVKIDFIEPVGDHAWNLWREKCKVETQRICDLAKEGRPFEISGLYKDKKVRAKYYLNDNTAGPFYRKCAYCEGNIESENGEIDHFRPKGRVSDNDYKPIPNHHGYYWLAYDWKNLLPSCTKCNQKRKWDKVKGQFTFGKKDLFPLKNEDSRVFKPTDNLLNEEPLLINPLEENPETHLNVDVETGIMEAKTPAGQKCIDIFGLNDRDAILQGRIATLKIVALAVNRVTNNTIEKDKSEGIKAILEILEYINGRKEFSLAARCLLRTIFKTDNYKKVLEDDLALMYSKI